MRDLRYGIEIEMTGLSRGKAAETLAGFFGTRAEHTGGSYDAYAVRDAQDRVWKLVSDGSIQTQKKVRGQTVYADSTYSVELVSPVCVYEDIATIQEIVRALRRNNALVNDSCGIHVHVGAEKFDAQHLRNITNIMASKEELIYKALQVDLNRSQDYCRRVSAAGKRAEAAESGSFQKHLVQRAGREQCALSRKPVPRVESSFRVPERHGGVPYVQFHAACGKSEDVHTVQPCHRQSGADAAQCPCGTDAHDQ